MTQNPDKRASMREKLRLEEVQSFLALSTSQKCLEWTRKTPPTLLQFGAPIFHGALPTDRDQIFRISYLEQRADYKHNGFHSASEARVSKVHRAANAAFEGITRNTERSVAQPCTKPSSVTLTFSSVIATRAPITNRHHGERDTHSILTSPAATRARRVHVFTGHCPTRARKNAAVQIGIAKPPVVALIRGKLSSLRKVNLRSKVSVRNSSAMKRSSI